MKKLFAIALKDGRLRFANRSEWLFFLILPIVFTLVLAGGTGPNADARVRLVVVDEANTPLSAHLLSALGDSKSVRVDQLTLAEASSQFDSRRVSSVLIIPSDFGAPNLAQGPIQVEFRQQPNNLNALLAYQVVVAEVDRLGSVVGIARSSVDEAERRQPSSSASERQAGFDAALTIAQELMSEAPARLVKTQAAAADTIVYDPRANSSAGQLITWVFIPLLGISAMFAYERQRGTLRRLLTTPTSRVIYLLGTILGQVALAIIQMLLLVLFGILVMKLGWGRSPGALALILLTTALAGAALGTLIGALVRSEGQANGLAWMLGMVMALLGGCWYPAELFPQFVRTASRVLPTTWAMEGMLNIVLRGEGVAAALLPAGVLLAMAALFLAIGVNRFRYE